MIETIIPKDEADWLRLRKMDVTSTEVAALFGVSPYMTHFELFHRKHDNLEVDFKVNERMIWGTRLQDSIARGVASDEKWHAIRRMDEYMRDPELKMGASFDFECSSCEINEPHVCENLFILEVKNVDSLAFRDGWNIDGDNVEAPPHIELQVQQQLALTGYSTAYIGALIGGNRVVLIKREPDQKVIGAIRNRIEAFWKSVDAGIEPRPDFEHDAGIINRLYAYAEPGKIFNADEDVSRIASTYRQASKDESEAKSRKDAAKAEILTLVGSAEKVLGENFTISVGLIGPAQIPAYERKGYRSFKISWKKEKP